MTNQELRKAIERELNRFAIYVSRGRQIEEIDNSISVLLELFSLQQKELIEKIKIMKKSMIYENSLETGVENIAYNKALSDILTLLDKEGEK